MVPKFLKSFLQACANCAQYFRGKPPRQGGLQPFSVGGPWELVSIDVTGPHTKTKRGNVYILTCQDYFSKWVECFAIPNQEAELVASILVEQVFCRYGFPAKLLSDKGSNFESRLFQEMCRVMGVTKLRTSSYRPSCNGLIERFHRCLHAMLTKVMSENQKDWDEHLNFVISAYRGTVHSTSNFTPNQLLFGRENRAPMDLVFGSPEDERVVDSEHGYVHQMQERMAASYSLVRENMRSAAERRKVKYDAFVKDKTKFQPGQLVYYYYPRKFQGKSFKFQKIYTGPWKIVEQTGPVNYKICKTAGRIPGPQTQIVHVDKLKLIHTEPGLEESLVPEEVNPPAFQAGIDGVRPRRVIKKPQHLINDYVCNLFSASSDRNALKCHLCPHLPFASRKLWKGHLFLVHGIKSANAREVPSEPPVVKISSIVTDRQSPVDCMPILEDISEDEGEKPSLSNDGCAVVASIFCDSSTPSKVSEPTEELVEDEPLILDEVKKSHELNIISTLIKKINEIGRSTMSTSLVTAMRAEFPELTPERIFALFEWTVWLSKLRQGESAASPTLKAVDIVNVTMKCQSPSAGSEKVASAASPLESDSQWDPMLNRACGDDIHDSDNVLASDDEMYRDGSPVNLDDAKDSVAKPADDFAGDEANVAVEAMFPESHQVDEDDFDFL